MYQDIKNHLKKCITCEKIKNLKKTRKNQQKLFYLMNQEKDIYINIICIKKINKKV